MSAQTITSTSALQEHSTSREPDQYTLWQIVGIWLAGSVPMWIFGWMIAPVIVPRSPLPPPVTYWSLMIAGMAWQFVLSCVILYRELGTWNWKAICQRIWLQIPHDPNTDQPNPRLFFWLVPAVIIYGLIGFALANYLDAPVAWLFPALHPASYQDTNQLAALNLRGQWWLLGIAVVSSIFNYFLGEELLFRGILLPKMRGAFGKYDWLANAVLFGMYHLHKPWGIATNIAQSLVLTLPARRFRSNWMALAVHGTESILMLAGILAAILGMTGG